MDEKEVLEILKNYPFYMSRLEEIKEQLQSICPKVTATYGNLAGTSSGGGFSSKVEDMGNRRYELNKKAEYYKRKAGQIVSIIEYSGLTEQERALMWWVAKNGRLQAFARQQRIGKDNVYKIRDRAVRKIMASAPQNGLK